MLDQEEFFVSQTLSPKIQNNFMVGEFVTFCLGTDLSMKISMKSQSRYREMFHNVYKIDFFFN